MSSPLAIYKLIVLYLLDRVGGEIAPMQRSRKAGLSPRGFPETGAFTASLLREGRLLRCSVRIWVRKSGSRQTAS